MEATHSFIADLRGRLYHGEDACDPSSFDWTGLHARMCAAHVARRELASADSPQLAAGGDFTQWTDTVRPAANASRRINLNDSTDGKAACPNADDVADHSNFGD